MICFAMAALSVVGTPALAEDPPDPASELYRPLIHYSPTKNWMNDPNGLVFYKGVYHLYYQYNPKGNTWGNMSWGHATSTDLLHWTEQPLAIPQDADADIFSGSIVVDHDNTSGFGTTENPPLSRCTPRPTTPVSRRSPSPTAPTPGRAGRNMPATR